MRVLHVIPSVAPRRGGPSFAVLEMVRALRLLGFEAEIATTDDDGDSQLRVEKGKQILWSGVPVTFFSKWNPKLHVLREYARSSDFIEWLKRSINNYDIIHCHAVFSFLPSVALAVANKHKIPAIARTMGHLDKWSLSQSAWKKKIVLAFWERRRLQSARLIHVTSETEATGVRETLGNNTKTVTIPLGVTVPEGGDLSKSEARSLLGLPEHDSIMIFFSRLHPKKRVEKLFDILLAIPELKLAIGGEGDKAYELFLRGRANELGITERVIWMGWLEGTRRGAFLRAGDVFVLPSSSENFGLAAVEAAACGIPVVLSQGVDAGRTLKKLGAGFVCSENEYVDCVMKILKEGHNSELQSHVVRKEMGWEAVGRRLSSVYSELVEKSL